MLILMIVLMSGLTASAQKFVLDPLFGDSVKCHVAVKNDTVWKQKEPLQKVLLEKGLEIEACGKAENSFYVPFEHEGKVYVVTKDFLKFSENNEADVVNPLDKDMVRRHSAIAHLYATYTPITILIALLFVTIVLNILQSRKRELRRFVLVVMPVCMALVAIIEIVGYWYIGSDFFWWADRDRFGFWGSLVRLIPMVVALAYQILSFKFFENALFGCEDDIEMTRLSIVPAAVGLLACFPVLIAYFFIVQLWLGWSGLLCDVIGLLLFLLTLVGGMFIAYRRNTELLDKKSALAATLFSVVYVVGVLIAIWGLILLLFKLLIEIIVFAVGCTALAPLAKKKYYRGSDGHIYSKSDLDDRYRRED